MTDTAGMHDAVAFAVAHVASDDTGIADSSSTVGQFYRSLDAATICTDTDRPVFDVATLYDDTLDVTDSLPDPSLGIGVGYRDLLALSDSLVTAGDFHLSFDDSTGLAEMTNYPASISAGLLSVAGQFPVITSFETMTLPVTGGFTVTASERARIMGTSQGLCVEVS